MQLRAAFAALLLGAAGALAQMPAAAATQSLPFADALVADDRGGVGFPGDAPARVLNLPDDWAHSRPGERGPVWYRLHFEARPQRGELLGLYIERACANVEIDLNGQRLHDLGRMSDPIAQDCDRPLLLALPAGLLAFDRLNTIDMRLAGYALAQVASSRRAAGLSAPWIGPYASLHAVHARTNLLAVTAPTLAAALLLLTGLVAFVMARARRRDSHLWYFGALAVGWALVMSRPWWPGLSLPNYDSELLWLALLPPVTLAAVQFLLHHGGWRSRPIELAFYAQCVALPASLLLGGPLRVHQIAQVWHVLLAGQVLIAVAFHLWAAQRARRPDYWTMALLVTVVALLGGLEWASWQGWLAPPWQHLLRLVLPLAGVVLGLRLMHLYNRALQTAEEGRQLLESRVREATLEAEKNFAQMAELRVEQVTQQERKRIAADLHDDLGAKLLTIVHTSESERISTLAREALEEMRLSVRGLTGKPVRLIDALGDWRAEVVARLSQTGVEGEWNAPSEDLPQTLSARAYVQTTRILREAVNNIIKHSGASRCTIRVVIDGDDFQLAIQDNGKGIPLELDGRLDRGHGMSSMKHRAKQLQGQCLVESGPGYGTVIRLTLPLERHTTKA